ncbi:hypothetical protein GGS23DRAFT_588108 [Durotheca rogersii]|uniref:uncharacterized protein n=1 Tax=Durotheca rogersii TaxID=419775 RepID=UPI0022210A94|nr:uncharacterized protein GGS23DRAFT_588108 [Durotheca rogersii]KAI5857313.1 hypothetical protein GGS23DRAFT_588108 [Durotheca rogersii]
MLSPEAPRGPAPPSETSPEVVPDEQPEGLFCAYCGRNFTRKEHLERHLPHHTKVKPYRCEHCQLSFSRRDLLHRHHTTYHEVRDPRDSRPGGMATPMGRTPIACLNCAQAKTGCDKRVPCARCADKNLECHARYARRSTKAAVRAARASTSTAARPQDPGQRQLSVHALNATYMSINPSSLQADSILTAPSPPDDGSVGALGVGIDPRMQPHVMAQPTNSPAGPRLSSDGFSPPHPSMPSALDDVATLNPSYLSQGPYQEIFPWPQHDSSAFDIYADHMPSAQPDIPIQTFAESSETPPSNSEPGNSSRGSIHTRSTSILSSTGGDYDATTKAADLPAHTVSDNVIPEYDVIIASDEAWPLARCNPLIFSGACPRTAIVHLESLEAKSRHEGTWLSLEQHIQQVDRNGADLASVVPLSAETREKVLAITQSFLHKALEIHRGGVNSPTKTFSSTRTLSCLVLPPTTIIEYFLRSYVRSLSFFFSLVSTGRVDPNEMLQENQSAALLVLLMIAQGASAVPTLEARSLSAGLIETCRISLFDTIEKDVEMSADQTTLRCALLFTLLGAWSGDKWLMDIAMGQRGMYLSMLKHAGMLEPRLTAMPSTSGSTNGELEWRSWLNSESQNRLVYNWVLVDQELSLFHDTTTILSIGDILTPLPAPDTVWMSESAEQWATSMQAIYGHTASLSPQLLATTAVTPSLYDLFQEFLHGHLTTRHDLTGHQLRLLLHPLQSLLCHLRQMLSCFSDVPVPEPTSRTVTKSSTMTRLEEVQQLLQKWYELTINYYRTHPACPVTKTNLILYHLISLNAVTQFSEVERLARREGLAETFWDLSLWHKRCILQQTEAVFHCGQVFRLTRLTPRDGRPSWWSAAVYRAALILWAHGVSWLNPGLAEGDVSRGPVAIDRVTPEDRSVIAYLWEGQGVPLLTRRDGTHVGLSQSSEILQYAIQMIEEGNGSRLGDGIRRKLLSLHARWYPDGSADAS